MALAFKDTATLIQRWQAMPKKRWDPLTKGNIRLIERLMMQVEHVLVANQLQVVT
jgi:hypothetical protein